jgi:hypothetical protein
MSMGHCDCCDQYRPLSKCTAAGGIETYACYPCRGFDEIDPFDEVDEHDSGYDEPLDDEERYLTETGQL